MSGTNRTTLGPVGLAALVATAFATMMVIGTSMAAAVITPTGNANALSEALDNTGGAVTGASLTQAPPSGNPSAVVDTELALFPLKGSSYTVLSTGDSRDANAPNNSDSLSTDNGAVNGGGGPGAFDLVQLRVDVDVPANRNCLTIDYRFLTEEFDEFVGSDFNDTFLVELDQSTFVIRDDGSISASNNFANGPDGQPTTVKSAGTSADNSLGTTYDGATPILRATTPVTPGAHSVYISVFDIADAIYDSAAFVDNLRLRDTKPENCTLGAVGPGNEDATCRGEEPTIFATTGVTKGTPGRDVILGTNGQDVIKGGGGKDLICALGGADLVRGQNGPDEIIGGWGRDDIRGNGGNDTLKGGRGLDVVSGQSGIDRVKGGRDNDKVFGGANDDDVLGSRGDDKLFGRAGDDNLNGGKGNDNLNGGGGNDRCLQGGGKGNKRSC